MYLYVHICSGASCLNVNKITLFNKIYMKSDHKNLLVFYGSYLHRNYLVEKLKDAYVADTA